MNSTVTVILNLALALSWTTTFADETDSKVRLSFPTEVLPKFSFDECQGETLSLDDLKGRPWVASFVFCRCTHTCPLITRSVKEVHDRVIKEDDETIFVTFTVDPKYDTPEVLKDYSDIYSPDRSRWKFVTGSQQQIYELIVNGFGEYVKENLGKARRPGFEVAHTERVVLVNPDGIPVGTFLGTNAAAMTKLRRILTGRDEFPEPGQDKQEYEAARMEEAKAAIAAQQESEPETSSEQVFPAAEPDKPATPQSVPSADEINAEIDAQMPPWTRWLPTANATLNSIATLLLLFGYGAIRRENKILHRNLMISAFLVSAVFLASYLTYHYQLGQHTEAHGRKFTGTGIWPTVYFAVLIPHVILAIFVPVLALRVFQHAFAERWDQHKWLARITFPIWLYVSVTGVIIYLMLYHWPS